MIPWNPGRSRTRSGYYQAIWVWEPGQPPEEGIAYCNGRHWAPDHTSWDYRPVVAYDPESRVPIQGRP